METTDNNRFQNNPVYYYNHRTEALDDAFKIFLEIFQDYSLKNDLSEDQIASFKQLIMDTYIERKANYFFESKFSNFTNYIDSAIDLALNKTFQKDNKANISKVFYHNNLYRLINHEQH